MGELFVLVEGGVLFVIIVVFDLFGVLMWYVGIDGGMIVYLKVDLVIGELILFCVDWCVFWLCYGVIDVMGVMCVDVEIELGVLVMMYDFVIIEICSLLFDLNVGYDFLLL